MSLRKRIQLLLGLLVGIPMVILLTESYRSGRETFLRQLRIESLQIAKLEEEEIDLTFEPPRVVAEGLARSLAAFESLRGEEVRELLRRTLHENPQLYGAGVFLDPGSTPLGQFAPYVFRKKGVESEITLPYDFARSDWYRLPVKAGRGLWSEPYFDEGGGETLMVTHTAPILREGRIVGVATVDLDLDGLVSRMRQIRPGGGGSVYLACREGHIVAHPDLKAVSHLDDVQRMKKLVELINARGQGMTEMKDPVTGRDSWVVENPIDSLSEEHGAEAWSVVVSWPLDARLAPLNRFARRMLVLYLFLGGAALLFLNRSFDQIVSRPLRCLAEQARRYAKGEFAPRPPGGDEAAELMELSRALDGLGETLGKGERSRKPS